MNNPIKRIPIAISGLMLGIVSLGNLLGDPFAPYLAILASILMLAVIARLIFYPNVLKNELIDPIAVSVSPTFAMAMVMLSKYFATYINHSLGQVFFYGGVILHLLIIIYFSKNFGKMVNRNEIYGSFMIVYGSFGAGAIVAPFVGAELLGKVVWFFGMVTFFPLLYMVIYKDRHNREKEGVKMPLFCICASNGGLLLTGYFNSFMRLNTAFIIFMIILGQLVYFLALAKLPEYLKLPFYPSFSSFTFPFVINATAMKLTYEYFLGLKHDLGFLKVLYTIETVIAIALVSYAFVNYMIYLFKTKEAFSK